MPDVNARANYAIFMAFMIKKMINEIIAPVPYLAPYITNYFIIEFHDDSEARSFLKVPPLGFPVIQFHYGERASFYNRPEFKDESLIIGQQTHHVSLAPVAGTKFIGINFTPTGLFELTGIFMNQLTNGGIDGYSFFNQKMLNSFLKELRNSITYEDKVQLTENFLKEQLFPVKFAVPEYIKTIISEIQSENGLVRIADFAVKHQRTIRTLERNFLKYAGVCPKIFAQILRHRLIIAEIYEKKNPDWQNCVYKGFYHDQSHFIKDFKAFTAVSPLRYLPSINLFAEKILR